MILKNLSFSLILSSIIVPVIHSQQDTIKDPVTIHGNIQLTNNGISFVPAFSLDRPAVITMLFINKNRLYYIPELDFGMDLKPWQIGNRLGYNIIRRSNFNLGLGSGLGLYFNANASQIPDEEFQLQRYTMGEVNAGYNFSPTRRIQVFYFYSHRLDRVGIESGHMIMVNITFNRLMLTKKSYLDIVATVVWLKSTAPFKGVYASQVTSFHLTRWKMNLFAQTTLPLYTEPRSDFIWNTGINFPF